MWLALVPVAAFVIAFVAGALLFVVASKELDYY